MRREKGRATEIRMDERGQRKKGQGNCGAKREGLSHESGIYGDNKGEDEEKKSISIFRIRIKGITNLKGGSIWIRENIKYREGSAIARKERLKTTTGAEKIEGILNALQRGDYKNIKNSG